MELAFWIFMLVMDLIIPITMIGFGKAFLRNSPKNINLVFGYRTSMSMKNRDTWKFAHNYCGKLWVKLGFALLPVSMIPLLFVLHKDVDTIGTVGAAICFVQCVPMVGSIVPTEIALRRIFDKNGKRRAL